MGGERLTSVTLQLDEGTTMKISEFITWLEEVKENHGDMPVVVWGGRGPESSAPELFADEASGYRKLPEMVYGSKKKKRGERTLFVTTDEGLRGWQSLADWNARACELRNAAGGR